MKTDLESSPSRARKRLGFVVILMGLLLVLLIVFHASLLSRVGHLVFYEDRPQEPVDAVIILAGSIPDRALEGADVLREFETAQGFLTQVRMPPRNRRLQELGIHLPRSFDLNRQVLLASGVADSRIRILPDMVSSTWEEAVAFRNSLNNNSIQSVIISTCRFHSYRAYLNFTKALEGTGVEVYMSPSKYCDFHPDSWWMDRDQVKRLYVEIASLTAFFLGWR